MSESEALQFVRDYRSALTGHDSLPDDLDAVDGGRVRNVKPSGAISTTCRLRLNPRYVAIFDMAEDPFRYLDEVLPFRSSLPQETDRGCALMAAAYLDDQAEAFIAAKTG
jgi:hypothetical protein